MNTDIQECATVCVHVVHKYTRVCVFVTCVYLNLVKIAANSYNPVCAYIHSLFRRRYCGQSCLSPQLGESLSPPIRSLVTHQPIKTSSPGWNRGAGIKTGILWQRKTRLLGIKALALNPILTPLPPSPHTIKIGQQLLQT